DYHDLSEFDGDETELVSLIGQDLYDELYQDIYDKNMNDNSFIAKHLKTYREDNGFEILDYYLYLDYTSVTPEDIEPNNLNQYSDIIAVYDDEMISVGDLLTHSLGQKTPLYLVHAVQLQLLKHHHFDDVYCDEDNNCVLDYEENDSDAMNSHVEDLFELENGFASSYYANYFSFEDYLYLAYGVKSGEELVENNYIKKTLEPLYVYDYIQANEVDVINDMLELIQPYYDNYFSLDVNHILIYIDENDDGKPDDFEEYYQELDDQVGFDTLVNSFKADIETYLSANEDDLSSFVTAYNEASGDDETWGSYKLFGLNVLTENLSSEQSLNYINSYRNFEEEFVNGLIEIYTDYQSAENSDNDFIYGQDYIETPYGLHFIKAEKGDHFEMPSAEFTIDSSSTNNYLSGLENSNTEISDSQIQIYLDYRIYEITSSFVDLDSIYGMEQPEIPSELLETLNFFLSEIYDSYFSVGYLNAAMVDELLSGQLVDQSYDVSSFTKAEIDTFMEELKEIYINQVSSQFDQ
ncbi:MAG: hypothetical protein K9L64_05225, partial [Candidatus Izimaplasma sp.]|nr:hypothetical protein [Candidatus Izimaplasma bacterium]